MPRPGAGIGLVGRGAERAELVAALDRARDGRAGAVLLGGDAGVGKSRLVAELSAAAGADGVLVLTGRCLDVGEASLPYLPFTEVLAALWQAHPGLLATRPALFRLTPGAAPEEPPPAASDRELGQLQVFDAVLSALSAAATTAPVLLVLEDLHWADRSTRELLTFLLSRLGGQRLLVLATYRTDDLHRRHPLRAALAELVRLPAVSRTELGRLPGPDTLALVRALAAGGLDEDVLRRIARRCEGNAFFAEEMVAACSDGLPDGLAELLLARTERLPEPARRVLRVASVAERRIRHELLAEVAGLGTEELEQGLREAVTHHVLVPDGDDAYMFRHALLREAVCDDLLPGERSRLHARFADLLAARGDEPGVAAELARHALNAHDLPRALAASVRAALEADRRHGPAEMLLHAERALELWPGVAEPERVAGIAESVLTREAAWAASASGDPERGCALGRRAVELADAHDGPRIRADVRRRYALRLMDTGAQVRATITAATEAVELLEGVPPCADLAWAHAVLGRAMLTADRPEPARHSAQAALDVAGAALRALPAGASQDDGERRDVLGARADALITLAFCAQTDGRAGDSRELLAEAVPLAAASGNRVVELRTMWNRGVSFLEDGLLEAAAAEFEAGERRAAESGITYGGYGLEHKVGRVRVAFQRGDWAHAAELARSVDSAVSSGVAGLLTVAGLLVTVSRGDLDEAERRIGALAAGAPVYDQTILLLGQVGAESALWRGQPGTATLRVDAALAGLRKEVPHHLGELVLSALGVAAWADRVPAGAAPDGTGRDDAVRAAQELLGSAETVAERGLPRGTRIGPEGRAWLLRARAELTRVRGEPDPQAWSAVVEAFGYGDVYRQAQARYRRAEALLGLARGPDQVAVRRLRADAGEDLRSAAATAAELSARPLADAVAALAARSGTGGAARSGAGAAAPAGPAGNGSGRDPLTPRERAVLEQVAGGLTNRRIGERLFISEKTVSVHLSRLMAKLGAGGRAEAVSLAYRHGLLDPGRRAGADGPTGADPAPDGPVPDGHLPLPEPTPTDSTAR